MRAAKKNNLGLPSQHKRGIYSLKTMVQAATCDRNDFGTGA